MNRLFPALRLSLMLLLIPWLLGFGGQHGKTPEPLTVIPLAQDAIHALAINAGVVSDARTPVVPQLELHVKQLDSGRTQLVLRNLSDRAIKLRLFVVHADGRFRASASCPLEAGQSSTEIWEEAFDAIGFGPAELLTDKDARSCA
jgi:hypothetical protein